MDQGDGVRAIIGKHGSIVPYSLSSNEYAVYLTTTNTRIINNINRKLLAVKWDDTEGSLIGTFSLYSLDDVAKAIKAKKRKKYSQEALAKMQITARRNFILD